MSLTNYADHLLTSESTRDVPLCRNGLHEMVGDNVGHRSRISKVTGMRHISNECRACRQSSYQRRTKRLVREYIGLRAFTLDCGHEVLHYAPGPVLGEWGYCQRHREFRTVKGRKRVNK